MFVEFHYVFNARIQKKKFQGGGGSDKYLWLPVGERLLRPILVILLRKFKKFEILMGPPPPPLIRACIFISITLTQDLLENDYCISVSKILSFMHNVLTRTAMKTIPIN